MKPQGILIISAVCLLCATLVGGALIWTYRPMESYDHYHMDSRSGEAHVRRITLDNSWQSRLVSYGLRLTTGKDREVRISTPTIDLSFAQTPFPRLFTLLHEKCEGANMVASILYNKTDLGASYAHLLLSHYGRLPSADCRVGYEIKVFLKTARDDNAILGFILSDQHELMGAQLTERFSNTQKPTEALTTVVTDEFDNLNTIPWASEINPSRAMR